MSSTNDSGFQEVTPVAEDTTEGQTDSQADNSTGIPEVDSAKTDLPEAASEEVNLNLIQEKEELNVEADFNAEIPTVEITDGKCLLYPVFKSK